MDYFNDYANLYPTSSTHEEFNAYQFLDQVLATEGDNCNVPYSTFADPWGMPEQPMAGSSTNILATDSYELLAPSTSYTNQIDSYGRPPYSGNYWPEVGQQAQPHYSGSLSQDYSLDSTTIPEPFIVDPAPDNFPLNNWGGNQSGPSTSTFQMENVYTSHNPGTGPARTGPRSMGRFQPYGRSRARRSEHMNMVAGPSTLIPPPVPWVGLPTLQPTGRMISETTADAEKTQPITEEDKVPEEPEQTERPKGESRRHRKTMQEYTVKLLDWEQRRSGLQEVATFNAALTTGLEVISASRPLVYHEHRLKSGQGSRITKETKNAKREVTRREVERGLFRKLSQYYPLRPGQKEWTRPTLFPRVMDDLERLSALPGPSAQPPP